MEERLRLDDRKRDLAEEAAGMLSDVMKAVFRWQMHTRGVDPYAALKEARGELAHLLDDVREAVSAELDDEFLSVRKGK